MEYIRSKYSFYRRIASSQNCRHTAQELLAARGHGLQQLRLRVPSLNTDPLLIGAQRFAAPGDFWTVL